MIFSRAQVTAARLCRSHSHAKSVSPRPLGGSSALGRPTRTLLVHRPRRPRSPSRHVHDPSAMYRSRSINGNRGGRRSWGTGNEMAAVFDQAIQSQGLSPTTRRQPHGAASSNLNNPEGSGESLEFGIPSRVNHDISTTWNGARKREL